MVREYAASAALELADEKYAVADEFLNSGEELLVGIAIVYLIRSQANAGTVKFLLPFLRNADEKIRARVLRSQLQQRGPYEDTDRICVDRDVLLRRSLRL